jgi:hypothetical protein
MVGAVEPKAVERGALFLIPVAVIVGVIAVAAGHWLVASAMVLLIVGQGFAFWKTRVADPPRQ